MILDDLAKQVQLLVPVQPWGTNGDRPVPLQISFDDEREYPWLVKFVIGLKNTQRHWAQARGHTLQEALQEALRQARSLKEAQ